MPLPAVARNALFTLCALTLILPQGLALADANDPSGPLRLSEPVEVANGFETFGVPLDGDRPVVTLRYLLAHADDFAGEPVQVSVKVGKVCQKKGCFFIAHDADVSLRVAFRDYAFFVPTDTGGKYVTLVGELVRRERGADEAAHLAQDAGGASDALRPGEAYEIVASGVRIPMS